MSGHIHAEPRNDAGRPLLFDGCEGCDRHAHGGGLTLDTETFAEAWKLMVAVDYRDEDRYLTENERMLCHGLYRDAVLMERHFGLAPWQWPVEGWT